jgi:putative oxidoreductase
MPDPATATKPAPASTAASRPSGGWLALVLRVVLAGLFILAGVLKLSDSQSFANAVLAFKIIPVPSGDRLVVLTTYIVPWTELIAGTCLLLGLWARASALVISLMLVVFIGGILSVMLRPDVDATCGCFGKLEFPCGNKVGACQLVRDVVMLAMGLFLVAKGPGALAIDREAAR